MKKWKKLLIVVQLLSLVLLSGCWSRRELEERIAVISVGIDAVKENGKKVYKVSIQIPIPVQIAGGGGGGGGGGDAVKVVSAQGETVAKAFSDIQKKLNQVLFMGHTRIIAISEEVAEDGVLDIVDGFRRDPAIRRLLWFLIVEGKAEDLLNSKPKIEQIPTVYIMSLIQNGARTGAIPDVTLGDFFVSISNKSLQPMANRMKLQEDDVYWSGLSLFDHGKMVGNLTDEESWILVQLRDEQQGGHFQVFTGNEENKENIVVSPTQVETKTKLEVKDGKVKAHYHVYMQANILEKNMPEHLDNVKTLAKLRKLAEKHLEHEAEQLINSLQTKQKVDVLRLGSKVKAFHYKEWEKMDWKQAFQDAEITVSYEVQFRRTGMQLN